jgi:hypothetical protein
MIRSCTNNNQIFSLHQFVCSDACSVCFGYSLIVDPDYPFRKYAL